MSDLREKVADLVFEYPVKKADRGVTSYEMADAILALVRADEAAIRADERAKVRAEATSDAAIERAVTASGWFPGFSAKIQFRAAIRAALGDET